MNIAIFVSTRGTILPSILNDPDIRPHIKLIFANRQCEALAKAQDIKTIVQEKQENQSREDYDKITLQTLKQYNIDLIVCVGYMKLFSSILTNNYKNKILNIHPSLLPKYPGMDLDVHEAVIQNKEKTSGMTIHYVDEGTDTGKILLQKTLEINENETKESLKERVQELEKKYYPAIIKQFIKPKLALISVSNKENIIEAANKLKQLNYKIISTGGTANLLKQNNIEVEEISKITNYPELMNGRVKTLHPKIHGGILADRYIQDHVDQAKNNNIELIDLAIVNLYPFKQTIEKPHKLEEAIENIDIGGPTIIRASAKNHEHIAIFTDPKDYALIENIIPQKTKQYLAVKAFKHTADYDSEIDKYLSKQFNNEEIVRLNFRQGKTLRYGENPHQQATFLKEEIDKEIKSLANAQILHGKEMSYNNYVDAYSAIESISEITQPAISIIKHNNPCGLATGENLREAIEHAWQGDTTSAYGSIIAANNKIDKNTAEFLTGKFVEAIIAPDYDEDALTFLKNKSNNLRIIKIPKNNSNSNETYLYLGHSLLKQTKDTANALEWKEVTTNKFPENKKQLALFTNLVAKNIKSNTIAIGYEYKPSQFMLVGMGAGQPNRINSLKLAVEKANENLAILNAKIEDTVLISDAFFPFKDSIEEATKHKIKFIVQPGGSIRDEEVINECNKNNIAMVFTNTRHFKH